METSRSPWKLIREAHRLASRVWPAHLHRFSRHDFALPQLFACLAVREMLKLSYRRTEALLRDSPHWLSAIGLSKPPDHNTLWRGLGTLIKTRRVERMLDLLAGLFAQHRLLKLLDKPLSIDSTCYEPHHRSRHYDRVCRKMHLRREGAKYAEKRALSPQQVNRSRSAKVRRMPKLALAVASGCHLILAARTHIGSGSDQGDFEPLLRRCARRVRPRDVVADAGYDSEKNHCLARGMKVRSVIPPRIGRPTAKPAAGRYRRLMQQRFARKADRRVYGQRAQSETVNSMMKRNLGEALRSIVSKRRKQEMELRSLTHDLLLWCAVEP